MWADIGAAWPQTIFLKDGVQATKCMMPRSLLRLGLGRCREWCDMQGANSTFGMTWLQQNMLVANMCLDVLVARKEEIWRFNFSTQVFPYDPTQAQVH
jgi:hypothetical protein